MSGKKLVSIDLWANMAVLKKPDVNKDIYLTYNILHKPMLLGILGSIIGLDGYRKNGEIPEYYKVLKDLKIGIQPLQPANPFFKASYQKTTITYNNSVGYASQEAGGNLIISEQTLIEPCFRCYILIDFEKDNQSNTVYSRLYNNLLNGESHYIPYLGKNEFQASWMDSTGRILFNEYQYFGEKQPESEFRILSVFSDDKTIKPIMDDPDNIEFSMPFFYFEHLPFTFHDHLLQYELKLFKYTNALLESGVGNSEIENLHSIGNENYVYLF